MTSRIGRRDEAAPDGGRRTQPLGDHAGTVRNRESEGLARTSRACATCLNHLSSSYRGWNLYSHRWSERGRIDPDSSADEDQAVTDMKNEFGHSLLARPVAFTGRNPDFCSPKTAVLAGEPVGRRLR